MALYGLILAGGRSTRMGQDKAALQLDGTDALTRAWEHLSGACMERFVSVRAGDSDPLRARFQQLPDQFGSIGPADGIVSAHLKFPTASWLVVACDLPLLDTPTLAYLCRQRNRQADATAFRSSHDGLPEPLCAIYEPGGLRKVLDGLNSGLRCPRKMLLQMNTHLLDQPNDKALENTNTPEDWRQVTAGR